MKSALFYKPKTKPVPTVRVRVPVHVAAAAMQPMVERRLHAIGRVLMPLFMLAVSIGFGMVITTMTGSTIAGYVVAILAALFLVVPQLAPPIPEAGNRYSGHELESDGYPHKYEGVPLYNPGSYESDKYWGIHSVTDTSLELDD